MAESISLHGVTKRYSAHGAAAVDDLTLHIDAGEAVMFVGPSGCGKTTSLKMINRLIEPTSGTITIGGDDSRSMNADTLRRRIGYVIQGGSLFPHLTVAQNVAVVPGLLRWSKSRTRERVDELLDLVGLDPSAYRDRYPRELSGGQQQRVGVARGLAADPPVVLMDEPFGAVDPITRQRLQDELLSIQRELGKTLVCVTHDIDEAVKLADRIVVFDVGARIAQYDTPENILAAPADDHVADFVGAGSRLKQLSLTRVDDVALTTDVPLATLGEPVADVRARIAAARVDHVVLLDARRRPLGWLWERQLRGDVIGRPGPSTTVVPVDHRATLNDAMDSMLASGHGGAVVTGSRGEYRGIVRFDDITGHVSEVQERAVANVEAARADEASR